jgi:hypothetical protein
MIMKQYLRFIGGLVLIALFLLSSTTSVQAEHEWDHRYTISGKVLDLEGDTVRGVKVEIDCSPGKTDDSLCSLNTERGSSTGLGGIYELVLHFHSSDHGKTLILTVEGEEFNHTIDLEGGDGEMAEEDRYVTLDLRLGSDVPVWSYFTPFIVMAILIIFTILFIMKKKERWIFSPKAVQTGAVERTDLVDCPKCDAKLRSDNMVRHLTSKHWMKENEAKALVGLSDEEEANTMVLRL